MNGARGEVEAEIGGRRLRLCLTLGALATIETALGAEGVEALAARMKRLSARDLTAVLAALICGGGAEPGEAERLAGASDPQAAAEAVARAFEAAAP